MKEENNLIFCQSNDFFIANTAFKHKNDIHIQYVNITSGVDRNQIDYIIGTRNVIQINL